MNRSYKIKPVHTSMRLDRWIKNNIGKYPQSLLEKSIRNGKIKLKIPVCSVKFLNLVVNYFDF